MSNLVKPVRLTNNRTSRRERWWQYAERAPKLYEAIEGLDRILVVARVSRTCLPVFVGSGQVMNEKTVVFPTEDPSMLSLLSSGIHTGWAWQRSSTLKADLNYAPSDVFETLPLPDMAGSSSLARLGKLLDATRTQIMLGRQLGLTKLYNAVHDSSVSDQDIQHLRSVHEEIDHAVAEAYGWTDLDLAHGFHQTRQGLRHTLNLAAQIEILDRLLELNQVCHAHEAGVANLNARSSTGNLTPIENALF